MEDSSYCYTDKHSQCLCWILLWGSLLQVSQDLKQWGWMLFILMSGGLRNLCGPLDRKVRGKWPLFHQTLALLFFFPQVFTLIPLELWFLTYPCSLYLFAISREGTTKNSSNLLFVFLRCRAFLCVLTCHPLSPQLASVILCVCVTVFVFLQGKSAVTDLLLAFSSWVPNLSGAYIQSYFISYQISPYLFSQISFFFHALVFEQYMINYWLHTQFIYFIFKSFF